MDTGEKDAKLKTITTVEMISRRKDGTIKEHIKINQDGTQEQII